MQFADRLNNVETSAIRELFKLLGKPGIISFAGGFPDSAMFDVAGISAAPPAALPGAERGTSPPNMGQRPASSSSGKPGFQGRVKATSVGAALLGPPPRPPPTGMRLVR